MNGTNRHGKPYYSLDAYLKNTYGPLSYLESIYTEALSEPRVAGISIATRPDCISEDTVTLLVNIRNRFPDKFVWIELGLQTIHQKTADFIRRGYPLRTYDKCVAMLNQAQIPVVTHIILGLPGDGPKDLLLAPLWSLNKRDVLNTLHHEQKMRRISQSIPD